MRTRHDVPGWIRDAVAQVKPGDKGMPEEPELTSVSASPAAQSGAAAEPAGTPAPMPPDESGAHDPAHHAHKHGPQRIPRWLERAELFLRVLLRLYIGLAVCYAPWSHMFWDQNPLFARYPTLGAYAANGAVRGIISGLGLLNLWIAFRDAVRHRDD